MFTNSAKIRELELENTALRNDIIRLSDLINEVKEEMKYVAENAINEINIADLVENAVYDAISGARISIDL